MLEFATELTTELGGVTRTSCVDKAIALQKSPILVDNLHRGAFFFRLRTKNLRGWGGYSKSTMIG